MGPRSGDRGEHCEPSRACRRSCFNGAAVRRPRRAASLRRGHRRAVRFNGAAVRRPRRVGRSCAARREPTRLQWGRGPETAESRRRASPLSDCASMGPRSGDRGESRRGRRAWPSALQWGRGRETAESARRDPARARDAGFNGAAVRRPRRDRGDRRRASAGRGFNGAAVRRPRRVASRRGRRALRRVLQWGRGPETAESAFV